MLVTLTLTLPEALQLAWTNELPISDSAETRELVERLTASMLLINDTSYDAFDNICFNATGDSAPAANATNDSNVTNVTNATNATPPNAAIVINVTSNGSNDSNGSNALNGSEAIVRWQRFEPSQTRNILEHVQKVSPRQPAAAFSRESFVTGVTIVTIVTPL